MDPFYDVGELYSLARITNFAKKWGLRPGWSFDYRHEDPLTGRIYDFLRSPDRTEANRMLTEDGADILTASPPCTVLSNLQNMNPVGVSEQEWTEGCQLLDHAVELCRSQMSLGRGFMFEPPSECHVVATRVVVEAH